MMVIQDLGSRYAAMSKEYSYNRTVMYQEFWQRYVKVSFIKEHLTGACLILQFVEDIKSQSVDMDSGESVQIIAAFSSMMSCQEFACDFYKPGEIFWRMDTIPGAVRVEHNVVERHTRPSIYKSKTH